MDQEQMKDNHFEDAFLPVTSVTSGWEHEVWKDIYGFNNQIVNVYFVGLPDADGWVLVDAGMPHSADTIASKAEERFGEGAKPKAIVLTHGHFDHVGAIADLLERWEVPVYAHEQELPYLTGKANYPSGDPTVDGGLVSELSPLFPNHGINLGDLVSPLPEDGEIPEMAGWRWIATPGHTPGHISLFREEDRALIAGDAFVTVKQESLYKVVLQTLEISGPPKYFTTDWQAARESVIRLESLKPSVALTGHGRPMSGELLSAELKKLADDFERLAVPEHGRFVERQ